MSEQQREHVSALADGELDPDLIGPTIRALEANAFDFLRDSEASGRDGGYGLIVLDPPAFAKNKASLDGAVAHKQFLLEPSPTDLLNTLLPLYVFHGLVQIVLEARASEHSARMVAMKGATENAKNIINGLTLDYNKARQTQITNELLEITTAMRAME